MIPAFVLPVRANRAPTQVINVEVENIGPWDFANAIGKRKNKTKKESESHDNQAPSFFFPTFLARKKQADAFL